MEIKKVVIEKNIVEKIFVSEDVSFAIETTIRDGKIEHSELVRRASGIICPEQPEQTITNLLNLAMEKPKEFCKYINNLRAVIDKTDETTRKEFYLVVRR